MEDRNEEAKESAKVFLESVNNGEINPASEDFNQGSSVKAPVEEWVIPHFDIILISGQKGLLCLRQVSSEK